MAKATAVAEPLTHQEDPLLGVCEIGRQLGKHHSTISDWCYQGLLKAVRMPNRTWAVRKSEVNKFLAASALNKQVV